MAFVASIQGLRELDAAFRKMDKVASKNFRDELKKAAEPVASSARDKISRFQGASLGTIKPRATATAVFVTQNARKVTGLRGDYGALQMRVGLEPALAENETNIVNELERALDRLGESAGF
jgi:hypothetical protein